MCSRSEIEMHDLMAVGSLAFSVFIDYISTYLHQADVGYELSVQRGRSVASYCQKAKWLASCKR